MIREAKREANFKRLGKNPSSKTIYRTLKTHNNPAVSLAADELNSFFSTVGEKNSWRYSKRLISIFN